MEKFKNLDFEFTMWYDDICQEIAEILGENIDDGKKKSVERKLNGWHKC